jgi:hypothetical protein
LGGAVNRHPQSLKAWGTWCKAFLLFIIFSQQVNTRKVSNHSPRKSLPSFNYNMTDLSRYHRLDSSQHVFRDCHRPGSRTLSRSKAAPQWPLHNRQSHIYDKLGLDSREEARARVAKSLGVPGMFNASKSPFVLADQCKVAQLCEYGNAHTLAKQRMDQQDGHPGWDSMSRFRREGTTYSLAYQDTGKSLSRYMWWKVLTALQEASIPTLH